MAKRWETDQPNGHRRVHSAYLALALDGLSLALYLTATLSAARLSYLMDSAFTGLRSFLADGPAGSSGLMILEYVAQSCLAELHRYATPAAAATAVISRGVEDHAPFSTEAARSLSNGLPAYRTVLSCELVAATRALRMLRTRPAGTRAWPMTARCRRSTRAARTGRWTRTWRWRIGCCRPSGHSDASCTGT